MSKKDKKEKPGEILRNNWYAVKLGYEISKSRVINAFFMKVFYYFNWVFFSAFFLRCMVDALDKGKEPGFIFVFVILCGILFFCINLYNNYTENVTFPLADTRLYYGIYRRLYTKAKNVELRCYEDSDFYNRYTMAIDDAGAKVTVIIDSVWGIITGIFAVIMVFYSMFTIAPFSVLFIISPLVGNFLFGNIKNKLEFRRYQESAPNDKAMNYVNRVMYLPDYAKGIRLSDVFNLLRRQYDEATDNNVKIAGKYAFRIAGMNLLRLFFTFTVIFEGVLLFAIYENMIKGAVSLAELTVMTSLMVSAIKRLSLFPTGFRPPVLLTVFSCLRTAGSQSREHMRSCLG